WMTPDGTQQITERTDYTQYENEVCPSLAIKDTGQGILTTAKTRAAIPGWQRALHCLEASLVLTGTHSDASLNFRYEADLERNSAGLVRKVESVVVADRLTLQEVFYNPDFTVDRISVPGRGSTVLEYQPGTRLLQRKTAPDFMVTEVLERDPVSDAVLAMETDRGLRRYRQFFRYDGQERLARQWDDLGVATSLNPNLVFSYRYATANRPAWTFSDALVGQQGDALVTQQSV